MEIIATLFGIFVLFKLAGIVLMGALVLIAALFCAVHSRG